MSKGLEALETMISNGYVNPNVEELKAIETELKALEIIKEYFEFNGFDELIPMKNIPEEKYDLLKEVLL